MKLIPSLFHAGLMSGFGAVLLVVLVVLLTVPLIKRLMPRKGKRVIYIASIQHQLQKSGVFEEGSMSKVNQILDLVNNDDALKLVELTAIPDRVWENGVLDNIVKTTDCSNCKDVCDRIDLMRGMCRRIVDVTPGWLVYSSKDDMLAELLTVFTSQPVHLVGAK